MSWTSRYPNSTMILPLVKFVIEQTLWRSKVYFRNKPKIFVVGANKTGTSSLDAYFKAAGYITSPQRQFELLRDDYLQGNRQEIFRLIKRYETFQDIPFSIADETFLHDLTATYPSAKFILSKRSSDEEWYQSLCRFHSKGSHDGKWPLTWDDVKKVDYLGKGRRYDFFIHVVGSEAKEPYDKHTWCAFYNNHNRLVRSFFKGRPNFLEINLADPNAESILRNFLGTTADVTVPHRNKS